MSSTLEAVFAGQTMLAVLRGNTVERTLELATMAWDRGIDVVEVTIQTDEAVEALAATVRAGAARGKSVGAGTVTSLSATVIARDAGAAFTVSPALDVELLAAHADLGIPHLPGVATATEVARAHDAGARWMKAFPAAALGTEWFRAMRGPFPDVRFVATGGMTSANASAYLAAGVSVIGIGSAFAA